MPSRWQLPQRVCFACRGIVELQQGRTRPGPCGAKGRVALVAGFSVLGLLRPHVGLVGVLIVCQIGQTLAALTLPSLSAGVIDPGLADPTGHSVLRIGDLMPPAALAQLAVAMTPTWLGISTVKKQLTETARARGRLTSLNLPAVLAVMPLPRVAEVWFGALRIAAGW